jgi:hypothetical protein
MKLRQAESRSEGAQSPPNKPLQRSGLDNVLRPKRGIVVLKQVLRARVLMCQWPAAELNRYATLPLASATAVVCYPASSEGVL